MHASLPTSLYRCSQVKALDIEAIVEQNISGFELMLRAGQAAFAEIQKRWTSTKQMTVYCGGGNNGGDGYIVAALAIQSGWQTQLCYLVHPDNLKGDARLAFEFASEHQVDMVEFDPMDKEEHTNGVIVDALLGIGVNGDVRGVYIDAIMHMNTSPSPVLAIDIPSGICGDTGTVLGHAVQADATISFIGLKQGLLTAKATEHTGDIVYADLGVSPDIFKTQRSSCRRLEFSPPLLPTRPMNAHKGKYGHVLVVAGDQGYGGAGLLAAEAALQSGAGMVTLATHQSHVSAVLGRRPEIMVWAISSKDDLKLLIESSTVIVLGPGLGKSSWSDMVFKATCNTDKPMVIDADGLNRLAQSEGQYQPRQNWVLTPHPGEATRLLNMSSAEIQADRFKAVSLLQKQYGGTCVLKGAGTLIASSLDPSVVSCAPSGLANGEVAEHSYNNDLSLCSVGNPAMAAPGMGDILAGLVGSLLAQGLPPQQAAEIAVWAHATAGDICAKQHGKHLLASELNVALRELW